MKENQNGILCHSNDYRRDNDILVSEMNGKDECWNTQELKFSVVMDDFTRSNGNEIKDSLRNESQNGLLLRSNGFGVDADSFASEIEKTDEIWNTTLLECSVVVNDSTKAPCNIPFDLSEKNMDLCTDRNIMECGLPKLIVCYKGSTCHVVKDICIDEGVLSDEKILVESTEVDRKGLYSEEAKESVDIKSLVPDGLKSSLEKDCDKDASRYLEAKEEIDIELLISDGLDSSSKGDIGMDAAKECDSEDSIQICKTYCDIADKEADNSSKEEFVTSGLPPEHEFGTKTSLKSLLEFSDCDVNEVALPPAQISCAESVLESSVKDSNMNSPAENLSYNSKVASGTITFRFENPESVNEQPSESQNVTNHEDGVSYDLPVASQVQCGEGESSFSTAGTVSGLITYSGPIPYSGSISLRSDSSTTSTHSFAFPILQPEWNSSPVRMAKADRRLFRKHRGWRQSLLCCRF